MAHEGMGSRGHEEREPNESANFLAQELVRQLESGAQLSPENIRSLKSALRTQDSEAGTKDAPKRIEHDEVNRETHSEDEIIASCHEFLNFHDERDVTLDQAKSWFREKGLEVQSISKRSDESWHIISVGDGVSGSSRYVVPAMKRGMGSAPLHKYFRLLGHSGLEPLSAHQVTRFPKISEDGSLVEWGVISI